MTVVETLELEAAAIQTVGTQLNNAMEQGRHQDRKVSQAIQDEVDHIVRFGPRRLPLSSTLVILAVHGVGGTSGFLWAAAAQNWPTCALFVILMILGVFLLDQVRLIQRRDEALKAGLYLAAADPNVSE